MTGPVVLLPSQSVETVSGVGVCAVEIINTDVHCTGHGPRRPAIASCCSRSARHVIQPDLNQ